MITNIEIKDCASYDPAGVVLNDLKEVNFIYGANGSGKTTISNVIANLHAYPQCQIAWKNNIEIKPFVYNRNFIDENFSKSKYLKGVFTLGKGGKDAKELIDAKKAEIDKVNADIVANVAGIEKNKNEKEANETQFEGDCWIKYQQLKDIFKPAFKGCSYKNTFKDRCKAEANNTYAILNLEALKEKAGRIYSGSTEPKGDISLVDFKTLEETETHFIWGKKILGKEDVDIAAMIKKLNNSDWVKQGRAFYSLNDGICPFCQQKSPDNFENQLNEYFDETYVNQLKILNDQKADYSTKTAIIVSEIASLLNSKNDIIDNVRLEELKKMLEIKIEANKGKIEAKIKEPSSTITLDNIKTELDLINELITTAKKKIELHNETVKNITRESSQLTKEVWRYIVEQLKSVYQNYNTKNITFTKSIEGLEKSKKGNDDKLKILKAEIAELEQLNTNIEHTKNEINTLLEKFGFTNFKLAEATEEKGSYQIIRPTGERVERTLSEGEKTFITFLYFYHWLKGSIDKDLISVDRVVVFDDPISSLDCDVLFIVSHLIRKTIDEIRSKTSNIKQIIILTHNVYFHKEVTFNIKRQEANRLKDETFWVLRKKNDVSKILLHEKNPVQTSYELLWREVKENPDSITIENSLRRIIENYFKMFGGISPDDILNRLDDEDKMTAASLLSWSNAGSHGLNDDLYIATESEKYLKVFKTIFERTKHIEHYNMMMGISPEVEEPINIE